MRAPRAAAAVDLRVKRVYETPDAADGTRILVDRLWPRGLSREQARVDLWLKDVAPSAALRTWFAHDPAKWEAFQQRYFDELQHQFEALAALRAAIGSGPATLLFGAREPRYNNAVALRAFLLRPSPPRERRG